MNGRLRWSLVVLFAAAMAWVEAAVVFYLRVLIDRVQPYQLDPLPASVGLGQAELVREASTLLMLGCVAWLAGSHRRARFGYLLLVFGAWDILYYVFLAYLSGWPNTLLDWDILFLIPLPWWGPVLAPVSIAGLMIITGTAIAQFDLWPRFPSWVMSSCGAMLALYTFIAVSLSAWGNGLRAVREVLPLAFNWSVFGVAILLMGAPLLDMLWLREKASARRQLEQNEHLLVKKVIP